MIIIKTRYYSFKKNEWSDFEKHFYNYDYEKAIKFCWSLKNKPNYTLMSVDLDNGSDYELYEYLQRKINIDKINGWE